MNEPATSATALATVKKKQNALQRWQKRNRIRRDSSMASDFIYWAHSYSLGIDKEVAMRAAIRAEPDDYLAAFAGLLIFPFFGLPLNIIKLIKKMHSKLYYGE